MRSVFIGLAALLASVAPAAAEDLTPDQLRAKVAEITQVQNKVMMAGSTTADIDALFALYTPDFVYVHEAYGGTYTRDHLYGNTVRALSAGRYNGERPRYRVVAMIPGHNGIAVEREEIHQGVAHRHLAVFEFRGDQVSRIIEYWK
jgi:hypothetical protein